MIEHKCDTCGGEWWIPLWRPETPQDSNCPYCQVGEVVESPNIKQMAQAGYGPAVHGTMSSFLAGRSNNQEYDTLAPDMRDFYLGKAKEAGVNVRGKVYQTGLAKEPGDPQAWVESHDDIKRRVKEENWTIIDH